MEFYFMDILTEEVLTLLSNPKLTKEGKAVIGRWWTRKMTEMETILLSSPEDVEIVPLKKALNVQA